MDIGFRKRLCLEGTRQGFSGDARRKWISLDTRPAIARFQEDLGRSGIYSAIARKPDFVSSKVAREITGNCAMKVIRGQSSQMEKKAPAASRIRKKTFRKPWRN
jgi:hypothetical protein